MPAKILIVESDEGARTVCREAAVELGLEVEEVTSLDDAFDSLGDTRSNCLLLFDLDAIGVYRLAEIRSRFPYVDVITLAPAARGTVEEATRVMRRGALDYIPKPLTHKKITRVFRRWLQRRELKEEKEHLSEVLHLMELGRTLTSTLELDELYNQISKLVQRAFLCDTMSLMLLEERNGTPHLVLAAQVGLPSQVSEEAEAPLEESIAGRVAQEGRPLLLLGLEGTPYEHLARGGAIGSAMSIPLKVQRRTIGVLNVNRRPGRSSYTDHDVQLLHVFASQIAIAIQNAHLYENVREERDRILNVQEQVRRELARNLHDGLAQLLATVAMNIDHTRMLHAEGRIDDEKLDGQLKYLRETIREAVRETRSFIFGLRPLILETKGLVAALESFLQQIAVGTPGAREGEHEETSYHLVTSFGHNDSDPSPSAGIPEQGASRQKGVPDEIPLSNKRLRVVFSIIQEAVQNARKHAHADNVWIRLFIDHASPPSTGVPEREGERDLLVVQVEDDGAGFDVSNVEATYDQEYSFGLLNMREQAELVDGQFRIDSEIGRGTLIELRIPVEQR